MDQPKVEEEGAGDEGRSGSRARLWPARPGRLRVNESRLLEGRFRVSSLDTYSSSIRKCLTYALELFLGDFISHLVVGWTRAGLAPVAACAASCAGSGDVGWDPLLLLLLLPVVAAAEARRARLARNLYSPGQFASSVTLPY